jgi:hypothetical protein
MSHLSVTGVWRNQFCKEALVSRSGCALQCMRRAYAINNEADRDVQPQKLKNLADAFQAMRM